ncbi:MAG: NUDIX hydrolase [FCB group bacterium]|jgi:ADP-ribose pyrophosphatase
MLKKPKQISSEIRLTNPYWDYNIDLYESPNGKEYEYHYVHSRGASFVIPKKHNTFVLIRQYRYLNRRESLEFPGGGIKPGKSDLETAIDELSEEAGYKAGSIKKIGEFNPYNGVTDEICSVFLAEGLLETKSKPDETEEFEIVELTKDEINAMIKSGEIWDGMTLAAWSLYSVESL